MLAKWCETTSCNGIINLYQARNNKPLFVIWAIVMMGMAVASVYFTYKTIKGYVDSPYLTTIETISNASFIFPEIAIAYNGGVDVDAFRKANFSEHFIHTYQSDLNGYYYSELSQAKIQLLEFMDQKNLTTRTIYDQFAFNCERLIERFSRNKLEPDLPCFKFLTNTIWKRKGPVFMFKNIGFQYGTNAGLDMYLYSPMSSYANVYRKETTYIECDKDFFIWIEMTLDNVRGTSYRIPINSIVTIQLFPKLYQRIPDPNKCLSNVTANLCAALCDFTLFTKNYDNNCIRIDDVDIYNANDSDICLPFTALKYSSPDEDWEICTSKCLPNCTQWKYDPIITFSPYYEKEEYDYSDVKIIYDSLQYLKISEVQSFTYDMAIANVGGQIGLWMGASIVTIVEAFYYLALMVTNQSHTVHPVKMIKVQDSLEQRIEAYEQLNETRFNLLKDMLTKIADEIEQNKSNDNM